MSTINPRTRGRTSLVVRHENTTMGKGKESEWARQPGAGE